MIDFLKAARWHRPLRLRLMLAIREFLGIGDLMRLQDDFGQMQTARLGLVLKQQVQDQREIRALREAVESQKALQQMQLDQIQSKLSALASAEELRYKASMERENARRSDVEIELRSLASIQETGERVLVLLEPHAAKLRARPVPVKDWDEVQRENLEQFKEKE